MIKVAQAGILAPGYNASEELARQGHEPSFERWKVLDQSICQLIVTNGMTEDVRGGFSSHLTRHSMLTSYPSSASTLDSLLILGVFGTNPIPYKAPYFYVLRGHMPSW